MANTGLYGPHALTVDAIDAEFSSTTGIGAYALGPANDEGLLTVKYVGRSDSDLEGRLKQHANNAKYSHFKYAFYKTAKAAFEKECGMYHDFNPSDNKVHPDRPSNTDWECPRCTIFD